MIPSDYICCQLANLMWNESHEDLLLGMTVCGLIVRNRMLAGWEDGQWLRLIEKHDFWHFTDEPARVLKFGDPHRDNLFRRCLGVAQNIYDGKERDITEGALWYCDLRKSSDSFREKICRQMDSHAMVATIGRQSCFR